MKKTLVLLLLMINLLLATQISAFNESELKEFKNHIPFKIEKGILKVNALGGFADGKYKLEKIKSKKIDNSLYKLTLGFEKKKNKFIRLKQKRVIFILYNGKKMWIKFKGKIYKFNLFVDEYIIDDKIFYKQKRSTLNAKIDKMNLLLSFN